MFDIIWFRSQIAAYNEKVEPVELAAQDIVTHYIDVSDEQDFYIGDQVSFLVTWNLCGNHRALSDQYIPVSGLNLWVYEHFARFNQNWEITSNVIFPVSFNFPIASTLLREFEILYLRKQKLLSLMFYCWVFLWKTVSQHYLISFVHLLLSAAL